MRLSCNALGLIGRLAHLLFCGWTFLNVVGLASNQAADRPNVILFLADDVSWNDYGCFGNPHARTPNIDRLAAGGIRFDQAFLTASSCSPSRASIVTGRYPHNNGKAAELHLPIAANLPWFPELLRQAGYYTVLSGKNHMQVDTVLGADPVQPRPKAFDVIDAGRVPGNSGGHANWVKLLTERPQDRPFFCWFASYDAHRGWDADQEWDASRYGPPHDAEHVVVPPFLIDEPETRRDLASYYNEITRFDYFIGRVVAELQDQGQLENTLIFVLADNGRPFPRAKTRLHDSGMKTGLVAHWPAGIRETGVYTQLISVIDLAPTILSLAGLEAAPTMQGVSMQPVFDSLSNRVRQFAFSEHNWHDFEAHGRAVRDGQFLYIRNNRPQFAWQGPADSVHSPSHRALRNALTAGALNAAQSDVFLAPRPTEELYVVSDDPDQLRNVISEPRYQADAGRLRQLLAEWTESTADSVPERISADSFDQISGDRLRLQPRESYRGTTPGEDSMAWLVNTAGPH